MFPQPIMATLNGFTASFSLLKFPREEWIGQGTHALASALDELTNPARVRVSCSRYSPSCPRFMQSRRLQRFQCAGQEPRKRQPPLEAQYWCISPSVALRAECESRCRGSNEKAPPPTYDRTRQR